MHLLFHWPGILFLNANLFSTGLIFFFVVVVFCCFCFVCLFKMPAVSLDLPSNVFVPRTFRTVVPMYIRIGEKSYSYILPYYFGIIFK